jgi:hypothetical protein
MIKLISFIIGLFIVGFSSVETYAQDAVATEKKSKVIYKDTAIDFEGLSLDGELKAPGEFYFQNRNQERFDSLSKRRLNFRREMLRDAVQSN